jgi:parallel beta-helix repeat protein
METKKILASKNVILATAIATVLLVAMVGSASAQNPGCVKNGDTSVVYRCGDTVQFSCTFNGSILNCPSGSWGLKVGAPNIVIDGAGYKITGNEDATVCYAVSEGDPSTHSGVINNGGHDNVVIKNLEVENFCEGIAFKYLGTNKVTNNTVCDCSIHDNGNGTILDPGDPDEETSTHGIHLVKAEYCTITRNDLFNNNGTGDTCSAGGNGFFAYGLGAGHHTITCNHVHNNRGAGIFLKKGGEHNTISYNNASANGGAGISPKCKKVNNCTIEYNTVIGNDGHGFDSQAAYNTYRYNTVKDNGHDGIHINAGHETGGGGWDYGVYNVITNNTICGHSGGSVDIWIENVVHGWTNTVDKNTCGSSNNATAFACDDWKCGSLQTIYYDYDKDVDCCSDTPTDWTCNNTLGVGACNNPGKFNTSAWYDHCLYDYTHGGCGCNTTGNDFNDCDASKKGNLPVAPVPELATILLFGAGLITLVGYVELRKRRKG